MEKNTYRSGGIGLLGVIQIVFIILKFVGVVKWSWAVTLIPLWIELGVIIIVLLVALIYNIGNMR